MADDAENDDQWLYGENADFTAEESASNEPPAENNAEPPTEQEAEEKQEEEIVSGCLFTYFTT